MDGIGPRHALTFLLNSPRLLHSGQRVAVRVLSHVGHDRVRLGIAGVTVVAQTRSHLPVGAKLFAVVTGKDSDGRISLELLPEAASRDTLPPQRLLGTSDEVLQALARSGLPITEQSVASVERQRRKGMSTVLTRVLALMHDKRIPTEQLPHLTDLSPHLAQERREGRSHSSPDRQEHQPDHRPDNPANGSPDEVAHTLSDEIRRDASVEGEGDSILQLFNHLPGRHGDCWVIIPVNVEGVLTDADTAGMHLHFPYRGATPDMATLLVTEGGTRWSFHWSPDGGTIRIHCSDASVRHNLVNGRMRAILENVRKDVPEFSVEISEYSGKAAQSDGFSDEPLETIIRRIDATV